MFQNAWPQISTQRHAAKPRLYTAKVVMYAYHAMNTSFITYMQCALI